MVRKVVLFLFLAAFCADPNAGWTPALEGWEYRFPGDHGNHPGFKTEWWYFTGAAVATSRFVVNDVKFAHFAVTEISAGRFHHFQRLARGAFGEAGFDDGGRLAWIWDWTCLRTGTNAFRIVAKEEGTSIELDLASAKAPVVHGRKGVSQKAEGEGRASHY